MPNWASVNYRITGQEKELTTLYETIQNLENGKGKLLPNDFGNLWLGNLVHAFGGDWEKVYCRGYITDYRFEKESSALVIDMEAAWGEMNEVRAFLREKFPSIMNLFIEEEPGNCVYNTNNKDFYDRSRYYLDCCIESRICDMCSEYFPSLEKVVEYIKENLEPSAKIEATKKAIEEFINGWESEHEDDFLSLNEFNFVG